MLRKALIIIVLGIVISGITISSIFVSAEAGLLPSWIKIVAGFWADDQISDNEFIIALQYLVEESILVLPEAAERIEDTQDQKADILISETNSKFTSLLLLTKYPQIQQILIDSNQEFDNIDSPYGLIVERNSEWISADKDEITPFMEDLIKNDVSHILRDIINQDKKETKYFVYEEIFITNSYGANVAQSGKTTDYEQDDELWWISAKRTGFNFNSGYDESANVYSLDISIRIDDEDGRFLGVMKSVVNIEEIVEPEF